MSRENSRKKQLMLCLSGIALCLMLICSARVLFDQGILSTGASGVYIGSYRHGSLVKHTFFVTNYSLKTVSIYSFFPDCNCSIAKIKQRTIPPFRSTSITFAVDTKSLRPGKMMRGVTLYLEDGRNLNLYVSFDLESGKPISAKTLGTFVPSGSFASKTDI